MPPPHTSSWLKLTSSSLAPQSCCAGPDLRCSYSDTHMSTLNKTIILINLSDSFANTSELCLENYYVYFVTGKS